MSHRLTLNRLTIPNTSLKILERLGLTMLREAPIDEQYLAIVKPAAERLEVRVDEVKEALIARFRETNPAIVATEMEFDRASDTHWIWLRKLLEGWHVAYTHPGLDALSPELQAAVELPELRKIGVRAGQLHERLFGAEGTSWVLDSYIEQSATMSTILGLIEADQLGEPLNEVVGARLMGLISGCQVHYEAMVNARMSRQQGPSDNFIDLRTMLRWELDRYKSTIENLFDPAEPETFEIIEKALRPLLLLNQRMANAKSSTEVEALIDDEFVELDLPFDLDDPQAPDLLEQPEPEPADA